MGGKAFNSSGIHPVRMDSYLYEHTCQYITKAAQEHNLLTTIPKHVREKPTHGDIDILVQVDSFDLCNEFLHAIDVQHVHRNGDVLSVAIQLPAVDQLSPLIQIDLIKTCPEWHDFATHYFSWNDAGNLYGRIAHKLGFDGLHYVLRDTNTSHVLVEATVTQDWEKALQFLSFDTCKDNKGYNTYDQLFEHIVSNPWFSRDIFLLDNRNHVSRTRDAKRATYMMFLQWLQDSYTGTDFPWTEETKHSIRQTMLDEAVYYFPDFGKALDTAKVCAKRTKKVQQYVNGNIIASITSYSGPQLGKVMRAIKELFPDMASYQSFVLATKEQAPSILLKKLQR